MFWAFRQAQTAKKYGLPTPFIGLGRGFGGRKSGALSQKMLT